MPPESAISPKTAALPNYQARSVTQARSDNQARSAYQVRSARPADVREISRLVEPYANERVLLFRDLVGFYEAVQEFLVAEDDGGHIVGCGALHVLWDDLGEIRTLAVPEELRRHGIGRALVAALLERAWELGLSRIFCLTFAVDFFSSFGFEIIDEPPVSAEVYAELLRSRDDGMAEFLDLARVKPNTLGNTRMLLTKH